VGDISAPARVCATGNAYGDSGEEEEQVAGEDDHSQLLNHCGWDSNVRFRLFC
jgi:hypothetical protein